MAAGIRKRIFPLLLLIFAIPSGHAEITPVWTSTKQRIVIEAEDVNQVLEGSPWMSDEKRDGYLGHGYVYHRSSTAAEHPLSYHIAIEEEGAYALAVRVCAPADETGGDTVVLRALADQGDAIEFTSQGSDTWSLLHAPNNWHFTGGIHEFTLINPRPGICIDRLYIFPAASDPGDPEESPSALLYPLEFDDPEPPSAPRNLRLLNHGCAHLHLLWDESQDDQSGVLGYDVYWRRKWVGRTYRPEFIMGDLEPYALYHVNVAAVDLAGNGSRVTSLTAETDPFGPSHGAMIKSAPSPFTIDGIEDASWKQQRAYPLTHPNGEITASLRLAWDPEHLYLMVSAPPEASSKVALYLDPALTQSASLGSRHHRWTFPDAAGEEAHYALTADEDGVRHEIAVPWQILALTPRRGTLIGLNVVIPGDDEHPGFAWRWDEEERATERPYQFGVVHLADGIPSGSENEWLPEDIWRERDGYAVIEAESIEHDPAWQKHAEPSGFRGEGLLVWKPPFHYSGSTLGTQENDYTTEHQGPQNRWLIVRVFTDKPGPYHCDVRFRQAPEPQRAWLWRVERATTNRQPIQAIGLEAAEAGEDYAWSSHGSRRFHLKRGINNLYLSAASATCAIDRVVLYREHSPTAKEKALDPETVPSQAFR